MKNIFSLVFICLLAYGKNAQSQFRYDRQGRPVNEMSYTDIEGDPYLQNQWVNGTVTLPSSKSVEATLKFDTYSNRLLFQAKNGEAMEFIDKLTGFSLNIADKSVSNIIPMVFVNNFPPIDKQTQNSWYQLIADGNVKLLKYYEKQTMDSKAFNSATTTKTFFPNQYYYIFKNNQMTKISLNKKSILKTLDHPEQVEPWLKSNNINFKSDADLQKLFNWYNTLN